jgi:hypothetical protein
MATSSKNLKMGRNPHIIYYTTTTYKKAILFQEFFTGIAIFGSLSVYVGQHLETLRILLLFVGSVSIHAKNPPNTG